MIKEINLSDYINAKLTALVGRPNGEKLLKTFKVSGVIFADLERNHEKIKINIPDFIVTINKSFFLGWMETRIKELGKNDFITKYEFVTTEHINERIKEYIDSALLDASPEEILNG